MTIAEIRDMLGADVLTDRGGLNTEIRHISACDLMSDVLSYVRPGAMLLTGLTNSQVVRTAEVAELAAICFVRGKRPLPETISLARDKRIPLLCTDHSLYEACGRLHDAGVPGH